MNPTIDLSIIIPAYKEGLEFRDRLKALAEFLQAHDYGVVEVVVMMQSDDQSGDREAAELAQHLFEAHGELFRVVNLGKRAGKGGAVRAGMFEAFGRYRLFMDADLATPLKHLDDVKRLMDGGGDVGIAVRDLVKIHKGLKRKLITGVGNVLAQVVLLPGISDTQCGFKVFSAAAAEKIFSYVTIVGWGFDLEVLALARKFGYKIAIFRADDWHDPKAAGAGLVGDSASGAALQVLRDLFQVRWNLICRRYQKPTFHYEPQRR